MSAPPRKDIDAARAWMRLFAERLHPLSPAHEHVTVLLAATEPPAPRVDVAPETPWDDWSPPVHELVKH